MKIKKFDSINVVPFIDIMLVLLVIVLTTATFVAKGVIPLELPNASSASKQKNDKKKILNISINKDGKIFFDKKEIAKENLATQLDTFKNTKPIMISCDKNMKFENFIFLLNELKLKNFSNLNIVTEK